MSQSQAAPKGAAKKAKQQEGNTGEDSGRKVHLADHKTARLLKAIVKALSRTMQDRRDVLSCCIDVLIGPDTGKIF